MSAGVELWSTSQLLTAAAHAVSNSWNRQLLSIGITHGGVITLRALQSGGPMTQADLARHMRVKNQTIGRTLHLFELQGWVLRAPAKDDKRLIFVRITNAGAAILDRAEELEKTLASEDLLPEDLRATLINIIQAQPPQPPSRIRGTNPFH
ncbi:DNA-binding MarR family transcriptional regulator [Arthrobacter sp. CAN_A6]|uniref:MarR family winged helix-turn-helix transcriptional regulator n=1 Tax=Arthrobacter sp. CAN_A6 TaxID=2787721 RepID=UPI0018CAD65B